VLYFIVRYYSLVSLIALTAVFTSVDLSVQVCKRYIRWVLPGGLFVFILALDSILLLRVFALYNRNKQIFTILLICVLADLGVAFGAAIVSAQHLAANVIRMPSPWLGCASKLPDLKFILIAYILNYILSLIFLGMTVWKMIDRHRCLHGRLSWMTLHKMDNVSPILVVFVRDGSIFFAIASVATFVGLLVPYMVHGPARASFLPWEIALYSYSGAHLILDLRAARTEGPTWNDTMSAQYRTGPQCSMKFTSSIGCTEE